MDSDDGSPVNTPPSSPNYTPPHTPPSSPPHSPDYPPDSDDDASEEEEEEDDDEATDDDDDDGADDSPAGEGGGTGAGAGGAAPGESVVIAATATLPSLSDPELSYQVREIGHEAVWSLSTAKPGNGVEQIRDSSVDTYWQSDGGQPHLINVQFARRQSVCEIAFYLDYNLDESYTPKRLSVRTGMTFHDLEETRVIELSEPVGWCSVPLFRMPGDDPLDDDVDDPDDPANKNDDHDPADGPLGGRRRPLRTHFVQVCVVSMHQNGRDTHIRQVKIFGPRNEGELVQRRMAAAAAAATTSSSSSSGGHGGSGKGGGGGGWACRLPKFQSVEMSQFSTIR